jgi:Fur family ferric uptake transcriptional regulator
MSEDRSNLRANRARLHQHGYRLTPQRYAIFQVLQEAERHLSIDEIIESVNASNPCVSISTIYRTLNFLLDLGLIQELHIPWHGTQVQYEVTHDADCHHLVCQRCHAVVHFSYSFPEALQQELARQHQFQALKPTLLVEGICPACRAEKSQEESEISETPIPLP